MIGDEKMSFGEKVKGAAKGAVKAAKKVKNIIKFFGSVLGQIVFWVIIILLCIILLYILANTIAKGVAKILGIEKPGTKETADYQILLELQNSGYNSLMDSKELQQYTAYEHYVLMDIAQFMEEKGVYVDKNDPTRFDESVYSTTEYKDALAKRRAAGLMAGFEQLANQDLDTLVRDAWEKALGSGKAEENVSDKVEDNLSNEEVKKEIYYRLVEHPTPLADGTEGENENNKALVPYLRLERENYRNTYYLLDKSTTNNLMNADGTVNEVEVEKMKNALDGLQGEGVSDKSTLSTSISGIVEKMKNIDGYYLNTELNRNMLSKALVKGKEFGDKLDVTKDYEKDQLYYEREDAGSCTYDIPLKVIVDRFLPKATLLSSWYMLKDDGSEEEESISRKVVDGIKSIYDEACLKDEEVKTLGRVTKNDEWKDYTEEKNVPKLEDELQEYTNESTSLILERAYLDVAEQYPWYFDKVKKIKPITDLVCGVTIPSNVTYAYKYVDEYGIEHTGTNTYDITRILSELSEKDFEVSTTEGNVKANLIGLSGEGYIKEIIDDTGMVDYPNIDTMTEPSQSVSGYYYLKGDSGKILITSDIIGRIQSKIAEKVKYAVDDDVTSVAVNIGERKAVFTCEEVKFPISQLVLRKNMPTYFPKQAKTWSRTIEYENTIDNGPKFIDNSTACLIPNCNEFGYQDMEINSTSMWRTKMYAPILREVRENDIIVMLSELESNANDGVYSANCFIRDLYKLIQFSKKEKDEKGKAYVDEDSYTYINISDEILLFNENTIDQIYWLNHLLATEEDPITEEENLTMRTKMDVLSWQNVEYELYPECLDPDTADSANKVYRVYALWPLGNYISRARYAALANSTVEGQKYTESWGGYQFNNRHAGVDLYGRRLVTNMKEAYEDGYDASKSIDDSGLANTETRINGTTYPDADSAIYAYELYRLTQASGSEEAAQKQLNNLLDKYSKDTPIVAVAPGIVTNVHGGPVCGFRVKIEHTGNNNCSSLYVHMKRWPNVQKGQYVGAGTVIGYEGTTGKSGAVHLHFELNIGGHKEVYPIPYLYPMFSPFYNEEKAEEAGYSLESEYMSLIRTVYPVGQSIGDGVITSPNRMTMQYGVKQREQVYSSDGDVYTTEISQVEEENGEIKIKNYVPSYPILENCEELYTYEQQELTDGTEITPQTTTGSSYKGNEFIQDLYYNEYFINYFKSGHVVVDEEYIN